MVWVEPDRQLHQLRAGTGGNLGDAQQHQLTCTCASSAQLRGEQPSYLKGDNFFKFVCSDCSEDGKESFERMRLTWQQVGL